GRVGVVGRVAADDAGREHEPAGVDPLAARSEVGADCGDAATIDGDPARSGGATKAVDDDGVVDGEVVHLGCGYFLSPSRCSSMLRTSCVAARQSPPPGWSYSFWTAFRNSAMAAACFAFCGAAASTVRGGVPTVFGVPACARSIQRPISFQSLSKKTTTGMD